MAENSSSRIFLIGAVVLGVLATVMAFAFIQKSAGVDRGPQVSILVAARDLRPNAPIDPDRDFRVEPIPVKFAALSSQCLDPEAKTTYKGQRLNRRVLAGQPVFLADLSAGGELTLQEPNRALTIPADAGLVIPGDTVQILVSNPEMALASGGKAAASAVLVGNGRQYKVLAVGGSMSRTRSQATNADQFDTTAAGKMVTLEVTAEQAREIVSTISNSAQRNMLLICPRAPAATAP